MTTVNSGYHGALLRPAATRRIEQRRDFAANQFLLIIGWDFEPQNGRGIDGGEHRAAKQGW